MKKHIFLIPIIKATDIPMSLDGVPCKYYVEIKDAEWTQQTNSPSKPVRPTLSSTFQSIYYGSIPLIYTFTTKDLGYDKNQILIKSDECENTPVYLELVLTSVRASDPETWGFEHNIQIDSLTMGGWALTPSNPDSGDQSAAFLDFSDVEDYMYSNYNTKLVISGEAANNFDQ